MVRLLGIEIENFKNIVYGAVDFRNKSSVNSHAELREMDINAVYGQNGSGKTALVEAIDVVAYLIRGEVVPYEVYEGLFDADNDARISLTFFVDNIDATYRAKYSVWIRKHDANMCLAPVREELSYQLPGYEWKKEKLVSFGDAGLFEMEKDSEPAGLSNFKPSDKERFLELIERCGLYAAGQHSSVFFCSYAVNSMEKRADKESGDFREFIEVVTSLSDYARTDLHVIKVSQLGYINALKLIPINAPAGIHAYSTVAQIAYLKEECRVSREKYEYLKTTIDAINIALKGVVADISLEIGIDSTSIDKNGKEQYSVKLYSVRGKKRFSVQYESEGIKRIISLLSLLISVFNNAETALVVDELDSGVFEFLLGELIGVMERYAKGQLIFTSHNLRVLERIPQVGIICSTTNPENRYIKLQGASGNNNNRDYFIRSLTLGGQKEELYSIDELEEIGYSFRKAGSIKRQVLWE